MTTAALSTATINIATATITDTTNQTRFAKAMDAIEPSKLNGGTLNFVKSICQQAINKGRLSEKQLAAVEKIAARQNSPEPSGSKVKRATKLLDLFKEGKSRLRFPKLTFESEIPASGMIRLSLAGPTSRNAGSVNITDGRPFGENIWYGKITPEGEFVPSNRSSDPNHSGNYTPDGKYKPADDAAIVDFLEKIAKNPVDAIKKYGKSTGHCCFCNKHLTDPVSLKVGYGKTCAGNWGMPYGK